MKRTVTLSDTHGLTFTVGGVRFLACPSHIMQFLSYRVQLNT